MNVLVKYVAILVAWLLVFTLWGVVVTWFHNEDTSDIGAFVIPGILLLAPSRLARQLLGAPPRKDPSRVTRMVCFPILLFIIAVIAAFMILYPGQFHTWLVLLYWFVWVVGVSAELYDFGMTIRGGSTHSN